MTCLAEAALLGALLLSGHWRSTHPDSASAGGQAVGWLLASGHATGCALCGLALLTGREAGTLATCAAAAALLVVAATSSLAELARA
jgi:hypothetical protein